MSEMYPTIKQFNEKRVKCIKDQRVVRYIVQEKLDGCNFRCILNADGKVTFGTRRIDLKDGEDFHGFSRIKKNLIDSTLRLKKLVKCQDSGMTLTVFGDLIGREKSGSLFVPRIDYLKDNSIAYYAYEIILNTEAYNGPTEDLIVYSSAHEPDAISTGKYAFLNFELAQMKLKEAGFNTIPYELDAFDEIKTVGQMVIPPFKSLLFGHSNVDDIEGYILRYKLGDGRWFCFKYKTEKFPGLENANKKGEVVNEDSWIDFMSKYNYGEITNENAVEVLIEYANDLEMEKNKKNFMVLQKFVAGKILKKEKGQKLSIYSGEALEKFLHSGNVDKHVEKSDID